VPLFVLDTDIVSNLMRPRPEPQLVRRLQAVPITQQTTTAVTIGELAYGARRAERPELYEHAMRLLASVRVLPFDRDAAESYGSIRTTLERAGERLPDPDLRIAATTLVHRATLITGNVRHFKRVPDLAYEDWLRS
jgi:tRNA(fMet)-specific endonuclease VapC